MSLLSLCLVATVPACAGGNRRDESQWDEVPEGNRGPCHEEQHSSGAQPAPSFVAIRHVINPGTINGDVLSVEARTNTEMNHCAYEVKSTGGEQMLHLVFGKNAPFSARFTLPNKQDGRMPFSPNHGVS